LENNQFMGNTLVDEVCDECGRRMANGLETCCELTRQAKHNSLAYLVIPLECPSELADQPVK
jgi:hypothetical protein